MGGGGSRECEEGTSGDILRIVIPVLCSATPGESADVGILVGQHNSTVPPS